MQQIVATIILMLCLPLKAPKPMDYDMLVVCSDYCFPCRLYQKAMEENNLNCEWVDVIDEPDRANELRVQAIPMFFLIDRNTGAIIRSRPMGSRSKGECLLLLRKNFPEYLEQKERD